MIRVTNIETFGWMAAIRGMRNSWNSWDKSDSELNDGEISIGPNDLRLMQKLYLAGSSHRKYLRMIHVQMDVLAPLYWWKEFDTYKVGTVVNSTSTMHKIADHGFTLDDFSCGHLLGRSDNSEPLYDENHYRVDGIGHLCLTINLLNYYRNKYLNEKNPDQKKMLWWQMIQLLPESYNQLRTIDMNYENVFTIIQQRTGHKLDEWNDFVDILKQLPYVKEIGGESK